MEVFILIYFSVDVKIICGVYDSIEKVWQVAEHFESQECPFAKGWVNDKGEKTFRRSIVKTTLNEFTSDMKFHISQTYAKRY